MADTRSHAISDLAEGLAIAPGEVVERLHALMDEGLAITVEAEHCWLSHPVECLSAEVIRAVLAPATRTLLPDIRVFPVIDSTNAHLLQMAEANPVDPIVCLAECQRAGRGRRGRCWSSPFAANLYLSLLWRFAPPPAVLSGLSLVAGVAVARALEGLQVPDIRLKWPNDLFWRDRKLGGLLLESRFIGKTAMVVIGLGLNVAMPDTRETIDQPWVDLREAMGGTAPSRNRLAAAILDQLVMALPVMQYEGLAPLLDDWHRLDGFRGRQVVLQLPDGQRMTGIALGIDDTGALRLATERGEQRFAVGEVSLRAG